jgi:hypothetical protein
MDTNISTQCISLYKSGKSAKEISDALDYHWSEVGCHSGYSTKLVLDMLYHESTPATRLNRKYDKYKKININTIRTK